MPGTVDFSGFDYADACYGTVENALVYFAHKPQQLDDFTGQSADQQQKLLLAATVAIDRLLFRGYKTPVFDLIASSEHPPTEEAIATADATQPLQFPRDGATDVPEDIVIACYEEAQSLLTRNADQELENLAATAHNVQGTSVAYGRYLGVPQHIANGITSFIAWTYLQPYLANVSTFDARRV